MTEGGQKGETAWNMISVKKGIRCILTKNITSETTCHSLKVFVGDCEGKGIHRIPGD